MLRADQALELGADVLGVLGHDRQVQGHAQVAGPQGTAEVGECGQDLLVGGVIGERWRWPARVCGGLAVVVPGEGLGSCATTAARHGRKAREPLVAMKVVLVDCLIYQGLLRDQQRHADASPEGDEPATIRMKKAHWLPAVVLRLPAKRPTLIDSITWGTARTPIYFPNI
jgi:hypothetical protein